MVLIRAVSTTRGAASPKATRWPRPNVPRGSLWRKDWISLDFPIQRWEGEDQWSVLTASSATRVAILSQESSLSQDDSSVDGFGEYTRGIVAMANAGPDTNGSQFFIMHANAALPKNYVIFGEVTAGMEVVDKIAEAPTQPGGEGSKPVTPVEIRTVEIMEGQ